MPHTPVLLRQTTDFLALSPGFKVLDCTLGEGGHGGSILEEIAPAGSLLGLDADEENLRRAKAVLAKFGHRVIFVQSNFSRLREVVKENNFFPVQAVLMDLGWSMSQFESSGRGFSFLRDEPLDMRFAQTHGLTASDILNEWSEEEIGKVLREYGEDREWKKIARAIIIYRRKQPITTTFQLVGLISELKIRSKKTHPATQIFQALRIAVNDELNSLKTALPQALEVLAPGGRLAIITFHSLEDRIVKQYFAQQDKKQFQVITKKPVTAEREEIIDNPRSRSAKLRVIAKL